MLGILLSVTLCNLTTLHFSGMLRLHLVISKYETAPFFEFLLLSSIFYYSISLVTVKFRIYSRGFVMGSVVFCHCVTYMSNPSPHAYLDCHWTACSVCVSEYNSNIYISYCWCSDAMFESLSMFYEGCVKCIMWNSCTIPVHGLMTVTRPLL